MVGSRLFGLKGSGGRAPEISAICIDKTVDALAPKGEGFADRVLALANETADLVGLGSRFDPGDIVLRREFTGAGYGIVGDLEREAIRLAAETEGILLDPVYTGRAMGAMASLARSGEIGRDETIVFWHTGGTPALFAYEEELIKD